MSSSKKESKPLAAGRVLKPQGVKGEIKVLALADAPSVLAGVKEYVIKDKTYAVERFRSGGGFAFIKLKGVDDMNAAETLRDAELFITPENRPKLPENRYYIADLLGCSVYSDGNKLGEVEDILQHGSADVFCVAGKKPFMFPAVDGVITEVNIEEKTIAVNAAELSKVAVYED